MMDYIPNKSNALLLAAAFAIAIIMPLSQETIAWNIVNESTGSFNLGGTPSGNISVPVGGSDFSETFSNPSGAATTTTTSTAGGAATTATAVSYVEDLKKQEDAAYVENTIKNDPLLQNTIKESLGLTELSAEKISEIAAASAEAAKSTSSSRSISIDAGRTTFSLSFTYSGTKKISNFIIYDTVPKSVAQSSDNITVSAGGAIVKIVEKDPKYSFTYPAISAGESKAVSYTLNGQLDKSVINNFAAPIFIAEKLEAPISQPPVAPSEGNKTIPPGETPQALPYTQILVIAAIVLILIIAIGLKKPKKTRGEKKE